MSNLYLFTARVAARERLDKIISDLKDTDAQFGNRACVYATGSFGRLEAGPDSDLDLFIITDSRADDPEKSQLSAVDEIKIKSKIIETAEKNDLAKFDGGGRFLTSHLMESFVEWLGSNEDDFRNTLTGRMLMLLESKPLVGSQVYEKTINLVICKYFRDYNGHEETFTPAFLFNDIIRMWRTFCVNYEFYRKDGDSRYKIKNLKLKFSRMLTCYSGIIYLLAIFARDGRVQPNDLKATIAISPTERLEAIAAVDFGFDERVISELQQHVQSALTCYSEFLELTHKGAKKALKEYNAEEMKWREKSYAFGRSLSKIIDCLGSVSERSDGLRRLILI
ncbi:nucleotidyltransferase domain-containing protein [Novosphingobium sp. PASSN1]|uniref:nucleotidyltransferase domain-containing protein n=1 Tax=Novosphingobium sp. PASSN1 TaxID=2015561 RepID=UPI0025E3F177|nr:nucleotidyltransferase domain-containing protein [Novosphingobium sp. PASSN1]